ncbi:hypothetical protein CWI75_16710 [Kineobactrum sediminis]|uniref:Outer membrane lipoprotein-sorting protein n=1 Tax=Kineobactrum sediminis TaxID=1905677 RepID=A0A2N5XYN6_9GAMM|nr:hypothetical protein [Kineobactrum sediminis]PLW81267.1 hypothetical protein CWI75_16710 [Kineobactrum sediminis]
MKLNTFVVATVLASALSAGPLLAQTEDEKAKMQKDIQNWAAMREEAIPAGEILAGDVKNIANPVGQVEELILNEKGTRIQYVLFEVPYPYSFYTGEDGFVNYKAVEVEDGYYGGVNLLIRDADVDLPRDQLKLTKGEARGRLVSRLIGSDIKFADGQMREVEDILVHPKTGMVTHYVVEMNPDALFDDDSRTIRATKVSIKKDGSIVTDLKVTDVEETQDFDPRFL